MMREIADNLQAIITGVEAKLPKGERNIRSILIKATMGPPVKVA